MKKQILQEWKRPAMQQVKGEFTFLNLASLQL